MKRLLKKLLVCQSHECLAKPGTEGRDYGNIDLENTSKITVLLL